MNFFEVTAEVWSLEPKQRTEKKFLKYESRELHKRLKKGVFKSGGGGALQYQMDTGVRLTLPKAGAFGAEHNLKKWGLIGWEAKFWFKIRRRWVRMLLLIFQWAL